MGEHSASANPRLKKTWSCTIMQMVNFGFVNGLELFCWKVSRRSHHRGRQQGGSHFVHRRQVPEGRARGTVQVRGQRDCLQPRFEPLLPHQRPG